MNKLMVSFQRQGGNTDEDINFFWSCSKNYSWQPHEDCNGRFVSLGSNFDLSLHQDTIEKLTSRAFD
jgi:hypothetical protein